MEKKQQEAFVQTFAPLYYQYDKEESISLTHEKREKLISDYGLNNLNLTHERVEIAIMELLKDGVYDKRALAWKAGKAIWGADKLAFKKGKDGFEKEDGYSIGERGGIVPVLGEKGFANYCDRLKKHARVINDLISSEDYHKAYKEALFSKNGKPEDNQVPDNFGPVNIFNALFFISKGKAPIYDAFAHKAIRALALDLEPAVVFMGLNPGKTETNAVYKMYNEYIILLKKVFPDYIGTGENNAFIPRDLDRALWVYGHSSNKWGFHD